jgi:hypothetical protein
MSISSAPTVAIVGAGPAGLMAAERLAGLGLCVSIYDHMPAPGRKLLMAGRGGLNLTHNEPIDRFLARYGDGAEPIRQAVQAFPPSALVSWVHSFGIETFVGSSERVFPVAMKASPLLRAWLRRLSDLGVTLSLRHRWVGWSEDGMLCFEHAGSAQAIRADATILALGGASWPRLGSDGRWVAPLTTAGIAVAPLQASNAGVLIPWSEHVSPRYAGAPLKRIAASCGAMRLRGEAIVTRWGLEGGAIYGVHRAVREAIAANGRATLFLDLRPDLREDDLARRLDVPRGKATLTSFLRKRGGLSPAQIAIAREAAGAGGLTADPHALARAIKHASFDVTAVADRARAISTAGGIRLEGIDDHFMLRARPGVFVAGEMLDWDAPTGGYLLQATFATAVAAANGCSRWLASPR